MAQYSHDLMVFNTLLVRGPLRLEGLEQAIRERYDDDFNRQMLLEGVGVPARVKDMPCIQQDDIGRYVINLEAERLAERDDIDRALREILKQRSEQVRDRLAQPDCENTKIKL